MFDQVDPLDDGSVPDEIRERAEQVRAHFVMLRAGGPFLSPTDAACLVRWLDEGIPVSRLIVALEQAAAARRKSRSRAPFYLSRAQPYLRRESAPAPRPAEAPAPLTARPLTLLHDALAALAPDAADALGDVDGPPEAQFREAMALIRDAFDRAWLEMAAPERDRRTAAAARPLRDFREELDDLAWEQLVEEGARDALRAEHPALSAMAIHGLLFG